MNIRDIALSLLVLSASCFVNGSFVEQEISIEEQDQTIQSLLEGKIDLCSLDDEVLASYIEIIEGHKAVLKHIITKRTGFANNIDAIKGVAYGWFGFSWFCNNLLDLWMHYEVRYGANLDLLRMKSFVSKNSARVLVRFIFMVMSGMFIKDSYDSLYKAWYIKENAINDLAKTEEMLTLLKSIQRKLP